MPQSDAGPQHCNGVCAKDPFKDWHQAAVESAKEDCYGRSNEDAFRAYKLLYEVMIQFIVSMYSCFVIPSHWLVTSEHSVHSSLECTPTSSEHFIDFRKLTRSFSIIMPTWKMRDENSPVSK